MSSQVSLIPQTSPGKLFQADVDQRLRDFVEEKTRGAHTPAMRDLWQHIANATHGGKRARPMLVNLGYQVAGDVPEPRLLDTACAFELLHTALVMHDDIIDQDFVRRGQPTLSAHYRDAATTQGQSASQAEHVGHSAAILAGDVLISQAVGLLTRACGDHPNGTQVIDVFHDAILQSAAGELDDVLYSAHLVSPKLNDVLGMHRLKTAAYSFDAPLRVGALLGGADCQTVTRLGQIGTLLGSCYQIIDDVLGTFGDCAVTGKPNDSDIREGKITVLIALAERNSQTASAVKAWRAGRLSDAALRGVLVAQGVESQARELAEQCCVTARDTLTELSIGQEVRQAFLELMDDLLERKH
ncbi:hypothetical protein GCM10009720_27850 [Yaniella flava]|uniref:Uncharacterized protein n=1 Tax=Yaniella flava TaxID=287930 RepID=A0ABP5GIT1_9MICC